MEEQNLHEPEAIETGPAPLRHGFPWWRLLLLPVGLILAIVAWGLAVGLGVAGLACILISAVTTLTGVLALLTHGLGTTILFLGGGLVKMGVGLLLMAWGMVMLWAGKALLKSLAGPLLPEKEAQA